MTQQYLLIFIGGGCMFLGVIGILVTKKLVPQTLFACMLLFGVFALVLSRLAR